MCTECVLEAAACSKLVVAFSSVAAAAPTRRWALVTAENTCPMGMVVLFGKHDVKSASVGMSLVASGLLSKSSFCKTHGVTISWEPRKPKSEKARRQLFWFKVSPMVVFKAFMRETVSNPGVPLSVASPWQVVDKWFLKAANT